MARFYGWTNLQIENLPSKTFHEYWLAITLLEAQEMIGNIKSSTFSDMKKSDRSRVSNDLNNIHRKILNRPRQSSFDFDEALSQIEEHNGSK